MSKGYKLSPKAQEILKKAEEQFFLEDADVRDFLDEVLISEGGYIMDTGTHYDVNRVMVQMFAEKIKQHPILWKLFMIG